MTDSDPWEVIRVLQLRRNVEHLDGYGNFPVPIIGMAEEVSKFCLGGDFSFSLVVWMIWNGLGSRPVGRKLDCSFGLFPASSKGSSRR